MILVDVWVPGAAKTKGSMVARPNGSMKESVIGSSAWRALMAQAVRDDIERRWAMNMQCVIGLPYAGAVCVVLTFHLPQPVDPGPAAAPILRTWHREAMRVLRATWQPVWERAGDVDKLARNVLDALGSTSKNTKMNGGAIRDDNLVCRLVVEKHVADPGMGAPPGVRIYVSTMDYARA